MVQPDKRTLTCIDPKDCPGSNSEWLSVPEKNLCIFIKDARHQLTRWSVRPIVLKIVKIPVLDWFWGLGARVNVRRNWHVHVRKDTYWRRWMEKNACARTNAQVRIIIGLHQFLFLCRIEVALYLLVLAALINCVYSAFVLIETMLLRFQLPVSHLSNLQVARQCVNQLALIPTHRSAEEGVVRNYAFVEMELSSSMKIL